MKTPQPSAPQHYPDPKSLSARARASMRRRGPLLAAFTMAACALAANSQAAVALFTVDGVEYQVPLTQSGDIASAENYSVSTPEFSVDFSGVLDADPIISFAVLVTDFGAPSTFIFGFFTPIVPTGPSVVVDSRLEGTLIDATGDGVSMDPTATASILAGTLYSPITPMGVDVGPAFSAGPGDTGATYTYGPYTAGPMAGPPGVWTGLGAEVTFQLSGGGDSASLAGFVQVVDAQAVPESGPGWVGLISIGLVALVGACLRGFAPLLLPASPPRTPSVSPRAVI